MEIHSLGELQKSDISPWEASEWGNSSGMFARYLGPKNLRKHGRKKNKCGMKPGCFVWL